MTLFRRRTDGTPTEETMTGVCGVCGGPAEPGTDRRLNGREVESFGTCPTCQAALDAHPSDQAAAAVLLAADLLARSDLDPTSEADQAACWSHLPRARSVLAVPCGIGGWTVDEAAHGQPRWSFVSTDARAALTAALTSERLAREPRPCTLGPCAYCGVWRATGWTTCRPWPGQRTPTWAACGDCQRDVVGRSGEDTVDRVRPWLTATALGMRRALMGWGPLQPYCAVMADDHTDPATLTGTEQRWAYVSEQDWHLLWSAHPEAAPPEWRERQTRKRRADQVAAQVHRVDQQPRSALVGLDSGDATPATTTPPL